MPSEFTITRRVEFSETDMAGMVHFSNFFRYMESAEHAFFRSIGQTIHGGECGWPRVHADCDYRVPLHFEDVFEVRLLVRERGERSISYLFIFTRDGVEIARGSLIVVCVRLDPATNRMKSFPIPEAIASRIEPAPPEALA